MPPRADLPEVFAYLDYRTYLRDWFQAKKDAPEVDDASAEELRALGYLE